MTPQALAPAAVAVLVMLSLYYWRFRRLFGRQRVQPARMKFRIAFLLLVGVLLMLRGMTQPDIAIAAAAGLAGGVALALLGLRLTRFESTPQGRFYTPHGGIGLALSALLVGRLAYRFFVIGPALQAAHGAGADPFGGFQRSPLTSAMFALLIGYYVAYYAGVLIKSGTGATGVATRDPPS
ncbi:MAG: DUF1453 domain-containing protein [Lysobacterales bacterium]